MTQDHWFGFYYFFHIFGTGGTLALIQILPSPIFFRPHHCRDGDVIRWNYLLRNIEWWRLMVIRPLNLSQWYLYHGFHFINIDTGCTIYSNCIESAKKSSFSCRNVISSLVSPTMWSSIWRHFRLGQRWANYATIFCTAYESLEKRYNK